MKELLDALDGRKTLTAAILAIVALYARDRMHIEIPDEVWAGIAALGAAGLNGKMEKATRALAASGRVVDSPPSMSEAERSALRKWLDSQEASS